MKRIAGLLLLIMLIGGCAGKAGPLMWTVGRAEITACDSGYTETGPKVVCKGEDVKVQSDHIGAEFGEVLRGLYEAGLRVASAFLPIPMPKQPTPVE